MLRVLTNGDVDFVLVYDRRGDDLVPRPSPAKDVFGRLGIAVELPNVFAGLWLHRVEPAIAARKDHLRLAADSDGGRVRPLAVQNLLARRVVLPGDFAGFLIHANEARRLRGRNV